MVNTHRNNNGLLETSILPRLFQRRADDFHGLEVTLVVARYWRSSALLILMALVTGSAYLLLTPPSYMAATRILVDPNRWAAASQAHLDPVIEKTFLDTQVGILGSRALAEDVVQAEHLATDAEFSTPGTLDSISNWIGGLLHRESEGLPSSSRPLEVAISRFQSRTRVTRLGATYLIEVAFSARSKIKAARLADRLSEAFVGTQQGLIRNALTRQLTAVDDELTAIRARETDLVQSLALAQSRILDLGNAAEENQREITTLLQQLRVAGSTLAQARDREATVKGLSATNLDALPQSILIEAPNARLIVDLARQLSAGSIGRSTLPVMIQTIEAELSKLGQFYHGRAKLAQDYLDSVQRDLRAIRDEKENYSVEKAKFDALQAQLNTVQFLRNERLKQQTEFISQRNVQFADVYSLTAAELPLGRSEPKIVLVLGVSLIAGVGLAAVITLLRNIFDDSVHSGAQVQHDLGLRFFGHLPGSREALAVPAAGNVPSLVNLRCTSRFVRTLNLICAHVSPAMQSDRKTIGVVSISPREGAPEVARLMAEYLVECGQRTLFIVPNINNQLLSEDKQSLPLTVPILEFSGSDLGQSLKAVLNRSKLDFSHIIVYLPPIADMWRSGFDAQVLDHIVLVIRKGKTTKSDITQALEAYPTLFAHVAGSVLS